MFSQEWLGSGLRDEHVAPGSFGFRSERALSLDPHGVWRRVHSPFMFGKQSYALTQTTPDPKICYKSPFSLIRTPFYTFRFVDQPRDARAMYPLGVDLYKTEYAFPLPLSPSSPRSPFGRLSL